MGGTWGQEPALRLEASSHAPVSIRPSSGPTKQTFPKSRALLIYSPSIPEISKKINCAEIKITCSPFMACHAPPPARKTLYPLISGTVAGAGWRASWRAPAKPKPHGNMGQALCPPRAPHSMETDS
jgi:hypothetical protein